MVILVQTFLHELAKTMAGNNDCDRSDDGDVNRSIVVVVVRVVVHVVILTMITLGNPIYLG